MTYAAYGAQADTEIKTLTTLNSQLKLEVSGLKVNVADLQSSLSQRDTLIVELRNRIAELEHPSPEYGPIAVTDIDALNVPDGFNYVTWKWPMTTPLQDVFAQLKDNDVLVLPENEKPYLIDTSKGFRRDSRHDNAMARMRAGVVGMGPNAVIDLSPSSFSLGKSTSTSGNYNKVLECWTPKAIIANFTMYGRDLGGCAFDAVKAAAPDIRIEGLRLAGAHRGFKSSPPGEAGGIVSYRAHRLVVRYCEVDCRDPKSGKSVGTSPVMLNFSDDALIEDCYLHHANLGAPTFYSQKNIITRRVRSEFNSSGFNHELVEGTVTHEDCTLLIDRKNRVEGRGSHLSIGTNRTSAKYAVSVREFDAGYESEPEKLFIQHMTVDYKPYGQKDFDISITDLDGKPIPILFGR